MPKSVLCKWCQTTVFNSDLLAVVYREGTTSSYTSPFQTRVNPVAYYQNRDCLDGFSRTFCQATEYLFQNVSQGCVFCELLADARGGLVDDFEFSVLVRDAWQWSMVTISGIEDTARTRYFRIYRCPNLAKPEFGHHLDPREPDVLEQEAKTWSEDSSALHPESSLAQKLAQDGRALRALIDNCIISHAACQQHETLELPSMLIHVSGTPASPSVCLVKVSEIKVDTIPYVCLSYCWGGPQQGMTTTGRLDSYLARIDIKLIPETVMDAIRVTISMGYHYLWVDAFCIIQDSGSSKMAEMGRMASIYSGAVCTICVMSAKAATEGFLRQSYPDPNASQSVYSQHIDIRNPTNQKVTAILEVRSDYSNENIWDSPILDRAWTLQEALLSPRLVVFRNQGQRPTLRCAIRCIQSDGGQVMAYPKPLVSLCQLEKVFSQNQKRRMEYGMKEEWVTIAKQYSHRSLTCLTDKMPALMGIVSSWETRFRPGKYWAGLWSSTLASDLLWRVDESCSPRSACDPFVAPSWSWTSRNHPIWYQHLGELSYESSEFDREFEVISCEIIPDQADLPYGAIKSAKLTLKCIAETVDLGDSESQNVSCTVSSGPVKVIFDDSPRPKDIRKAWLLYLNNEEPYNTSYGVGIAIAKSDSTDDDGSELYRRVGRFVCTGHGLKGPRMTFTII